MKVENLSDMIKNYREMAQSWKISEFKLNSKAEELLFDRRKDGLSIGNLTG